LLNNYNFPNAIDYYGSFLTIIKNFKLNVAEDIDYYLESDFFIKNKNKLFKIEDYEDKPLLNIEDDDVVLDFDNLDSIDIQENSTVELTEFSITELEMEIKTPRSESSCSSRSSHTNSQASRDLEIIDDGSHDLQLEKFDLESENSFESMDEYDKRTNFSSIMETVNIIFDKYLVQVTSLEHCEDTLDNLVLNDKLETEDEWLSCFFQIIMSLIVYQDTFAFTHNDLHTNNVMYNHTTEKYLYYLYNGIHYKVPTFGRIFKIIDFGRSIYKINGKIFCSNSFQPNGDAATQYNTEPNYNEHKKRIDPNYSFDLCRLACSLWDNMLELGSVENIIKQNIIILGSYLC
jgi:hypothetical protein